MSVRTDASASAPTEPIAFDSFGAPIYAWSIGARINDDTRRQLLERINTSDT